MTSSPGLRRRSPELGRGERREGHEVRRRAGVDEQGVREAQVVRDARLELLGEAAGGQVEVEARVDQEAHLLLAEHAAGVAHGVPVGVERRRRMALPVVPAHQLEDLAAGVLRLVARVRHLVNLLSSARPRGAPPRGHRPGRPELIFDQPAGGGRGPVVLAVPRGRLAHRGLRIPDRRPAELLPRLGAVEAQPVGLMGLVAGIGRRGPGPGAPLLQEALDHPAHRPVPVVVRGPEVPGAFVAAAIAQHEGREPEVPRQRLEDVLPGSDGIGVPDDDRARRRRGLARSPG